ncbi:MAG: nucleotide exchange factor GrpE, partial [Nitrospirae bacterium]
ALHHSSKDNKKEAADAIRKGVEMILKDLKGVLKKYGVEPIPAVGEVFDPSVHHAMAQVETEDKPDNIVVSEFRKGYKFKDKVIRASLVGVSKKVEKKKNSKTEEE